MTTSLIQFNQIDNTFQFTLTSEGEKCEFLRFLINTSNFAWRKGTEGVTEEDKRQESSILLSKMCAIGYLIFHIKRPDNARAVILTDYMNAVPGRCGKSLFVEFVKKFVETTHICCNNIDITRPFFWNDLSDKTRLVFLDELNPDFNFKYLFPFISDDWVINHKGSRVNMIPFEYSPKIILSTNHKIKGVGFDKKIWEIPFSDYYYACHKPIDDFDKLFFRDWTVEDWRLSYMLVADCVQLYLEYGYVSWK